MLINWQFTLIFLATLGSGLLGGVFFIFSNTVMKAFTRLPADQGIAAMQSINTTILNPMFLSVFMGTSALSILLALLAITQWEKSAMIYLFIASVTFFVGTFLVTAIFNVPLNDTLATVEPTVKTSTDIWNHYLSVWTSWNHVRTMSALVSCVLYIYTLLNF